MSRSAYGRGPCWFCGKEISSAGFAWASHMRAHVRRGELVEVRPAGKSYPLSFCRPDFLPKFTYPTDEPGVYIRYV